jgi:hypothetical protein
LLKYDIDLDALQYASTDAAPRPSPMHSAEYLSSDFDVLEQFKLSCSATNPIPNISDGSCFSAANRYCQSQGYGAGGFLVEWYNRASNVVCVTSSHASLRNIDISALSGAYPGCTR